MKAGPGGCRVYFDLVSVEPASLQALVARLLPAYALKRRDALFRFDDATYVVRAIDTAFKKSTLWRVVSDARVQGDEAAILILLLEGQREMRLTVRMRESDKNLASA